MPIWNPAKARVGRPLALAVTRRHDSLFSCCHRCTPVVRRPSLTFDTLALATFVLGPMLSTALRKVPAVSAVRIEHVRVQ